MALHSWLSKRELGEGGCLGQASLKSSLCQDIYSSFRCLRMWSPQSSVCHMHHGGIFNFDFSLDGSVLVVACERQSVLVFDPHNARLTGCQEKAHTDCVNYVRFLDSRLFATCSDDKTVRLWDLRFLKKDVMTLRGHSNWVKNIEYARSQGLLVTSGFDGSICSWDINKNRSSESVVCNPIFHTNGLMRSRLTPDGEKLVITTTEGYIIVIHDLDLSTLSQDLSGFKPSLYRVMQTRSFPLPQAYKYNSLFTRKTNRVELISDFPPWNDAEMIASLDVHPQGWCIVSRNTGSDEDSEWTCIHDIQGSVDDVDMEDVFPDQHFPEQPASPEELENDARDAEMVMDSSARLASSVSNIIDLENPAFQVSGFPQHGLGITSTLDSQDDSIGSEPLFNNHVTFIVHSQNGEEPIQSVIRPTAVRETRPNWRMHKNKPRLMHYIEEPNVGRGFIKEICFSNDGRLICSPFANGVRMLAFDASCSELCDCIPSSPIKLHEVVTNINRGGIIVSNKFSPTDTLLVTGCLEGKIGFHQPVW